MKPCTVILFFSAIIFAMGCTPEAEPASESGDEVIVSEEDLRQKAERLSKELIIVDSHIDIPYRMTEIAEDISVRTKRGDFDYPRAVEGGLNAAFMSIYIPAAYQETGGAKKLADELIDMVEGFEQKWPDKFAVARSPEDVLRHFEQGLFSVPMGIENGAALEGKLENLEHFYRRGIRYITLTHSRNNAICDSSYDSERSWNGLSPFGEEVVREMNQWGIMVDVSHISDQAFSDVMEVVNGPVIASHSSCRHFTPGWERNMSDDMIRRLGDNGGVIQINFGSSFLDDDYRRNSPLVRERLTAFNQKHGLEDQDSESIAYLKRLQEEFPPAFADITDVVAHINHVVDLVGIDHVGLGSDFDGVGDSLPFGLKDVSEYPNLIYELLKAGYSEEDIEKICSGNLLRVWREVERIAGMSSSG